MNILSITFGRHQKWKKKEIEIFKDNISNQNLQHTTSSYFKNKFEILNFLSIIPSFFTSMFHLKLIHVFWVLTLEMSGETLNDFAKVTSGYEIWSWEIK
jgi:hypothetical protein